jgi:hypothetical protein
MLSNTNEQLRRRVDDQKMVIQQLTAVLTRVLDDHKPSETAEPHASVADARALLLSLKRGTMPMAASAVSDASDDEAPSASPGFRTFFSSLVTRFTSSAPPAQPTTPAPAPAAASPSLDSSFRAVIDELGSAAVAPYVPASMLTDLPADANAAPAPAPPVGVFSAWLKAHDPQQAAPTPVACEVLRVITDASVQGVRVPEAPSPASPASPVDDADLILSQMLTAVAPAAPSGDLSSAGTDADVDESDSYCSSDEDTQPETSLPDPAALAAKRYPSAPRLEGFPAASDVERMTQRLRHKRTPAPITVPDAALGGLARPRLDPEAERQFFADKVRSDEQFKLTAERTFLEVFGSRMLEEHVREEGARQAEFQRHVANIREHLHKVPAAAGREHDVVRHLETLYNRRRARQFNEAVDEKLRGGLLRILGDPSVSWKAREQAQFIITRGSTITANDDTTPVNKLILQHLNEEEFCGRLGLDYSAVKPELERIEKERMKRLQEETHRDFLRIQRKRAISSQVKRTTDITGYYGSSFVPMKVAGTISKGIEHGVDTLVKGARNRD